MNMESFRCVIPLHGDASYGTPLGAESTSNAEILIFDHNSATYCVIVASDDDIALFLQLLGECFVRLEAVESNQLDTALRTNVRATATQNALGSVLLPPGLKNCVDPAVKATG